MAMDKALDDHEVPQAAEAYAEAAKAANLVYVSDDGPGITRRRAGHGFVYYDPGGNRITDPEERRRLAALAIPPAYTNVWISPDPRGHIQATGRDDRGRKQYRYHPDWQASRDDRKFGLLLPFARALPTLREQVDSDLRRHKPSFEKAVAAVVLLLDRLLIRVGNEQYASENDSYGLTTLKSRHLRIEGHHLKFRFRGKSGKLWNLDHADRRIARAIRSIQELPGQQLFQYVDDDGATHAVRSSDVNDYIRDAMHGSFTSRQFRTWSATTLAAVGLSAEPPAASKRARAQAINSVLDRVSHRLGNTRAVCRRSYVHPLVFETYETGKLAEQLSAAPVLADLDPEHLGEHEQTVLRWLAHIAEGSGP